MNRTSPGALLRAAETRIVRIAAVVFPIVAVLFLVWSCVRPEPKAHTPGHGAVRSGPRPEAPGHAEQGAPATLDLRIDHAWSLIPAEFSGGIDAALGRESGAGNWFSGRYYLPIDMGKLQATTDMPVKIAAAEGDFYWRGLQTRIDEGIDAAFEWDAEQAYFFRGDSYLHIDRRKAGTPQLRRIADPKGFGADFPPAFRGDFDAAVNDGLGNIYIFKGDLVLHYDRYLKAVLGAPERISSRWPGLPNTFHSDIDAAMRVGRGKIALFRDGKTVDVVTRVGSGGVSHR